MDQWDGRTYYDRPQLKPAPFDKILVGSYVFLAGLSGGVQLLSTLLDLTRGAAAQVVVRRGRLLAMLAPTAGSALLIGDLHTPKRFYNMLRVFKRTSPMSIGTWILMTFSGFSGVTAIADRIRWLRGVARVAQVPAAAAGAGLGTYTASLFSATSTPLWAAAPRALAVRFAASSIASAAAALSLCSRQRDLRHDLDSICLGALAVELAATLMADEDYRRTGVNRAFDSADGQLDTIGGTDIGTIIPLGLLAIAMLTGSRSRTLSAAASCAVLGGSLMMRIGIIGSGAVSASRPDISLRFTQSR
jgi:protein NrfD